jgi:hypothetical protein
MYRIKKMDASSVVFTLGGGLRIWGTVMAVLGGMLALLGGAAAGGEASGAPGVAGAGLAFFFAGLIMLQARRAHPVSLVFDNMARHFVVKARRGTETHIGYAEIDGIFERYLRERGHMVYMRTKNGSVFDLWSSGWTGSKKGVDLARRLNELVKFQDSTEIAAPAGLPGWVTRIDSGDVRYYCWKDRGAATRLFFALGLFTGLVLTAAGFSSAGGLSGTAAYAAIILPGLAAIGAAVLSIRMTAGVNVLAVEPATLRLGRARRAIPSGFREKKSMDRARLVSVRYSFDTAQGLNEFIMFLDRESHELLDTLRAGNAAVSRIGGAFRTYFHIFKLHITGRPAAELLAFARVLERDCHAR